MRKLFVILALLIAGLGTISHSTKQYVAGTYYVGDQTGGDIDYRAAYNQYQNGSVSVIGECDKSPKQLPDELLPFSPTDNNLVWFWAASETLDGVIEPYDESNINGYEIVEVDGVNYYKWDIPRDSYLLAIGDVTLIEDSRYNDRLYPDTGYTKGVHMKVIMHKDNKVYRITYGSMSRWWCCMDKKTPDSYYKGELSKPVYGHSKTTFDNEQFYAGSVIGLSGRTGSQKDCLLIRVEESEENSDIWKDITLEMLYNVNLVKDV